MAPTNGWSKAVAVLTQTGLARARIEIGRTCSSIHKQGINTTTKAVGPSSREKRLSPLVSSASTTVTIAIPTIAETTPLARMPSTITSAGKSAISEVNMMKAAIIRRHHSAATWPYRV
jgi:hypothetical protein